MFLKKILLFVEKDVTRTDRTHKFFEGECNPNLQVLNDCLMTYCMYNFDLGKSKSLYRIDCKFNTGDLNYYNCISLVLPHLCNGIEQRRFLFIWNLMSLITSLEKILTGTLCWKWTKRLKLELYKLMKLDFLEESLVKIELFPFMATKWINTQPYAVVPLNLNIS